MKDDEDDSGMCDKDSHSGDQVYNLYTVKTAARCRHPLYYSCFIMCIYTVCIGVMTYLLTINFFSLMVTGIMRGSTVIQVHRWQQLL